MIGIMRDNKTRERLDNDEMASTIAEQTELAFTRICIRWNGCDNKLDLALHGYPGVFELNTLLGMESRR